MVKNRQNRPSCKQLRQDLSATQPLLASALISIPKMKRGNWLQRLYNQGNTEVVQALLEAGADVRVKTGWWNCVLTAGGHSVIAAALLIAG